MTRKEFLTVLGAAAATPRIAIAADRSAGPNTGATNKPQPVTGTTTAVTDFILSPPPIPDAVLAQAKRCLIDGFGVVLAGATVHGSGIVRAFVTARGGTAEATVLGPKPFAASVSLAALANGASGHAMDYDDTQLSSSPDRVFGLLTHPTVPVLSASLAVGERLNVSGRRFLEAFLTGFEVECKIAEAINPDHYLRGFHSTGTIGTLGAAASAATLLGLDATKTSHALGIAASMSAGLRVNFGSMTKPLHAGRAAENGVVAAELAAHGFTAGDDPLDGPWGFFQVMGGGADVTRLIPVLGKPFSIVDPGVSVKPYPCGSLGHPTMDAMMKLVKDHDVKPDQVQRVRVRAGSNILNPLRYKTAKTELEAKFCLPFMMSAILLRRRAGIREFTDEFVASAPVQAMMARVDTVFDPAIEAKGFDKMRSIVEVDLKDGTKLVQAADERYRGGPERPFTREELHDKFADCAGLYLSQDRIAHALDTIESLERVASIRELTRALAPA